MALKPLQLILQGIDRATGPLKDVSQRIDRIAGKAQRAGRTLTTSLTLPIVGAGIAATKLSSDFELTMSRIEGLVGVAREQVTAWNDDLLDMAPAVGRGPGELGEALFQVTSAGLRGTKALDAVRQAARGATAGLGETATVADAVTSAMNAYGHENLSAGRATGILVAAVREGKLEASTLAPVLGTVIPIASKLGVGFDQVAGSIAALTQPGNNPAEAATQISAFFSTLLKPTKESEQALAQFGLTSAGLRKQLAGPQGMASVLQLLDERLGDNQEAWGALFPNIRALRGVLAQTGESGAKTQQIFSQVAKAGVGDLDTAFGVAAQTRNFKFAQAMATIRVEAIRLGDELAPIVVPAVQMLTDAVQRASQWFRALSPSVQKIIFGVTGLVAVAGPLVFIFGSIAAVLAALSAPVVAVVLGLSALGAAAAALLVFWEPIRDFFIDLPKVVVAAVSAIAGAIPGLGPVLSVLGSGASLLGFGSDAPEVAPPGLSSAPPAANVNAKVQLGIDDDRVRVKDMEASSGVDFELDTGLALAGS